MIYWSLHILYSLHQLYNFYEPNLNFWAQLGLKDNCPKKKLRERCHKPQPVHYFSDQIVGPSGWMSIQLVLRLEV